LNPEAPTTPAPISPSFAAAFAERASPGGQLRFDAFVDLALYHPTLGYYRQHRRRVGYGPGSDFFTASTSGPIFGELVSAACTKIVGPEAAGSFVFVEIGAENEGGILSGVAHPFKEARTIQLGETLELSGPCIVFSNELFDAQPFRRFRFIRSRWRELGVALRGQNLVETELPELDLPPGFELPASSAEGYTIDAPLAAAKLAEIIARQPWTGAFVAFDYGKTWLELAQACPIGTARAYFRHAQSNNLLARPGEQDLTCHICWDWIAHVLKQNGFDSPQLDSQESFLIRHGEAYLAAAIAADASRLTPRKQSLMQLLHASHLGQKFQVLHAVRR
jgi:SAM-dependent MidA family methyltransferase